MHFSCDCSLHLICRLQESPGRTASGSPRPAGRAGQTTVSGSSPMTTVKKPDPNMKGRSSEWDYFRLLHLSLIFWSLTFSSSWQNSRCMHTSLILPPSGRNFDFLLFKYNRHLLPSNLLLPPSAVTMKRFFKENFLLCTTELSRHSSLCFFSHHIYIFQRFIPPK